jgi:hypothetical protein
VFIGFLNMNFDQRIFESVEHATPEKPHDLAQILAYVDAFEKDVLSYRELAGGLKRLIEEGRIAELPGHKFHGLPAGSPPGKFSGLTHAEYNQACKAYHEWFQKTWNELKKTHPFFKRK